MAIVDLIKRCGAGTKKNYTIHLQGSFVNEPIDHEVKTRE